MIQTIIYTSFDTFELDANVFDDEALSNDNDDTSIKFWLCILQFVEPRCLLSTFSNKNWF